MLIDVSGCAGLRGRALIGAMTYAFARVGAALGCWVDDVFVQQRCLWIRLHEKGDNHSFRAMGITAYLANGGTLERAAAMANHASTRTIQLYDRSDAPRR